MSTSTSKKSTTPSSANEGIKLTIYINNRSNNNIQKDLVFRLTHL